MTVDPELFRSHGIDPVHCKIVVVKSPNGFRAAYEPIAKGIFLVDTPGVSTAKFARLPFKRVPRPIYPLDPDTPAPVRFLPHWDANLLVHARRTGLLPEAHRPRVFQTRNPQSKTPRTEKTDISRSSAPSSFVPIASWGSRIWPGLCAIPRLSRARMTARRVSSPRRFSLNRKRS